MKKSEAGFIATGMAVVALALSGCNAGPTYGTDKTTGEQLVDDFSNIVSIRSKNKASDVDTKPRPELVRPSEAQRRNLPAPQENVARAGSQDWPESPEERRKRLRAEATENQGNPNYVSPITNDGGDSGRYLPNGLDRAREREDNMPSTTKTKAQRKEFKRRKKENEGGTAEHRKYLSEPPLTYRQPSASAPVGEEGPDEAQKERERKAAARKKTTSKWWPF